MQSSSFLHSKALPELNRFMKKFFMKRFESEFKFVYLNSFSCGTCVMSLAWQPLDLVHIR